MGVTFVFLLERNISNKDVTDFKLPNLMKNYEGQLKQWEVSGQRKSLKMKIQKVEFQTKNVFCRFPILGHSKLGYV